MKKPMRERGVIFDSFDVQATQAGHKTQHRIPVVFSRPFTRHGSWREVSRTQDGGWVWFDQPVFGRGRELALQDPGKRCPLGEIGDRLWVRETYVELLAVSPASDQPMDWGQRPFLRVEEPTIRHSGFWNYDGLDVVWRADGEVEFCDGDGFCQDEDTPEWERVRWSSPVTMPRAYSRLSLQITGVRVDRSHDILSRDLAALGLPEQYMDTFDVVDRTEAIRWWRTRWDSRNRRPHDKWKHNPWCWIVDYKVVKR